MNNSFALRYLDLFFLFTIIIDTIFSINISTVFPAFIWAGIVGVVYIIIPIRCIYFFFKGHKKEGIVYLLSFAIISLMIYFDLYNTYWCITC